MLPSYVIADWSSISSNRYSHWSSYPGRIIVNDLRLGMMIPLILRQILLGGGNSYIFFENFDPYILGGNDPTGLQKTTNQF